MGTTRFGNYGYIVSRAVNGMKAEDYLTVKVRDDSWIPVNNKTVDYAIEIKERLDEND